MHTNQKTYSSDRQKKKKADNEQKFKPLLPQMISLTFPAGHRHKPHDDKSNTSQKNYFLYGKSTVPSPFPSPPNHLLKIANTSDLIKNNFSFFKTKITTLKKIYLEFTDI